MKHYDLIWIGTGQATGTLIPRLSEAGKSVAVIEGGRFGGSCVNYGCTPTKTLVASARAAHMAHRGPDFGVNIEGYSIDFDRVMARQNAIRAGGSNGLENWLEGLHGVELYRGNGQFEGEHNDHTAFRDDSMPFAGLSASGLGVGGIPYTIEDMQFEKMMVIKHH
jgi:pyruvate/2-oxoglutarate dehydrogenase complex dihydrolipoamide dehydrogenase (E3) component